MKENLIGFFNTLEEHNDASLFGKLKYNIVSMDGLGMNPKDLLSGKAQNGADGTRVVLGLSGHMTGQLVGSINGRDFITVHPGTDTFTNAYATIATDDGSHIAVKILGETSTTGEICYQIQLRHYGPTHSWVNEKYLFAKGSTVDNPQTELTIYAFDENPLDTPMAWVDPDLSLVDYKNFGYTLEDFQSDDAATLIYNGNGLLNGIDSFGADVNKVFTGQFPIPAEGLRLNGFFSGPTAGSLNGVITGINYLRLMPDGSMIANSKILVNTYEAETLLIEAQGAGYRETGPAWWETSRTYSNLEKYSYLTKQYNLGVGSTNVQTREINYNHYAYTDVKLENQQ